VDLEAPVSRYIEDLPLEDKFGPASTVENLLTLQGGYAETLVGTHAPDAKTWLPLGDYLAKKLSPRDIPPGMIYSYNSWEHALLGYMLEKVTGKPFPLAVEQNLFAPIGMQNSTFIQPLPASIMENLATGYAFRNGKYEIVPHDFVNLSPGIAMVTTGEDMGRFMLALLNNGELNGIRMLSSKLTADLFTPKGVHYPDSRALSFGLTEITFEGRKAWYHDGNGIGFGNRLVLLPEEKFGVFISVNHRPLGFNATPTPAYRIAQNLASELVKAFIPKNTTEQSSRAPLPNAAKRAFRYVGHYRLAGTSQRDFFKVGALLDNVSVINNQDGSLQIGSGRYVEVEPLVFQNTDYPGAFVVFVENLKNEIEFLTFGGTGSYKKTNWYETFNFQVGLAGFMLLVFLSQAVVWPFFRQGSRLIWGISLIDLMFLVGFGVMMSKADLILFFKTVPLTTRILLLLPWISGILFLLLPLAMTNLWGNETIPRWVQIQQTVTSVSSILFLWFAAYWRLFLTLKML